MKIFIKASEGNAVDSCAFELDNQNAVQLLQFANLVTDLISHNVNVEMRLRDDSYFITVKDVENKFNHFKNPGCDNAAPISDVVDNEFKHPNETEAWEDLRDRYEEYEAQYEHPDECGDDYIEDNDNDGEDGTPIVDDYLEIKASDDPLLKEAKTALKDINKKRCEIGECVLKRADHFYKGTYSELSGCGPISHWGSLEEACVFPTYEIAEMAVPMLRTSGFLGVQVVKKDALENYSIFVIEKEVLSKKYWNEIVSSWQDHIENASLYSLQAADETISYLKPKTIGDLRIVGYKPKSPKQTQKACDYSEPEKKSWVVRNKHDNTVYWRHDPAFRKDMESFLKSDWSHLLPDVSAAGARDVAESIHDKSRLEAWHARMEELSRCYDDGRECE